MGSRNTFSALFSSLLKSPTALLPELQARILSVLTSEKNTGLLLLMLKRPDLDPAVDQAIGELENPTVRSAWLARPGRTAEEIAAKTRNEKRVRVLAAAAGIEGLPEELYRSWSNHDGLSLTRALAANTSAPEDLRRRKLVELVEQLGSADGRGGRAVLAEACGDDQELWQLVLRTAGGPAAILEALSALENPQEYVDLLLEKIPAMRGTHYKYEDMAYLFSRVADLPLNANQREDLAKLARNEKRRFFREAGGVRGGYVSTVFTEAIAKLGKQRAELDTLLRNIRKSNSARGITNLVAKASSMACKMDMSPALAQAVLENPATPEAVAFRQLLDLYDDGEVTTRVVLRWEAEGRYDRIARASRYVDWTTAPAWFARLKNPEKLLPEMEKEYAEQFEELPDWLLDHPAFRDDPATALRLLPWNRVLQAKVPGVLPEIQRLLAAHLGGDEIRWETATALSTEFEGTLPELLQAAELL